jgi:transcriptional regulator with XRE-family HTH domain
MPPQDSRARSRGAAGPGSATATVGSSIRSLRKLKGLRLRDLAAHIGCSESLLSKIETGSTTPSLPVLARIAESLQVSVGALVPPGRSHLLEANLHTLAPGAGSRGTLSHVGEEVGYVLEGRFELRVGDAVFQLRAGDSFTFRSEDPHSYRNPGRTTTRVLWASTPSRSATVAAQRQAARRKP